MVFVVVVSAMSMARCKRVTMGRLETAPQCAISADPKVVTVVSEGGASLLRVNIMPVAVEEPGSVKVVVMNV